MRKFAKITTAAWLAGILVFSVKGAPADQIGYAITNAGFPNPDVLYRVNLTTATATLIGGTGTFNLEGLAISPDGNLFATGFLQSGGHFGDFLYSINKNTGAATLIGETGLADVEGLDFNGTTLVGTDRQIPNTVYAINTTNAVPTPIINFSLTEVNAMAVLNPSTIYVSVLAPPSSSILASVSLITGASTVLGQLPNEVAALDFGTDGNLYALDRAGNDFIINQTNGSGTFIGNTGGQFWLDLTIPSAVPEPSSMSLLLITVLGLIGVRARRGMAWLRR